MELAEYWLTEAAYQGHAYAQFFLDHMDEQRKPSVVLAATRMLYHLGNIFRDNTPLTAAPRYDPNRPQAAARDYGKAHRARTQGR